MPVPVPGAAVAVPDAGDAEPPPVAAGALPLDGVPPALEPGSGGADTGGLGLVTLSEWSEKKREKKRHNIHRTPVHHLLAEGSTTAPHPGARRTIEPRRSVPPPSLVSRRPGGEGTIVRRSVRTTAALDLDQSIWPDPRWCKEHP